MKTETPACDPAAFVENVRGAHSSIFSYRTKHKPEILLSEDYFAPVAGRLTFGDRIFVDSTGGAANAHFTLVVTMKAKGTVKVAPESPPSVR